MSRRKNHKGSGSTKLGKKRHQNAIVGMPHRYVVKGCDKLRELRGVLRKELEDWETRHLRSRKKEKVDVGVEKEREKEEAPLPTPLLPLSCACSRLFVAFESIETEDVNYSLTVYYM